MLAIAGVTLRHFVYRDEVPMDLSANEGGRQKPHCEASSAFSRFFNLPISKLLWLKVNRKTKNQYYELSHDSVASKKALRFETGESSAQNALKFL